MNFNVVSAVQPDRLQLTVDGRFTPDLIFELIDHVRSAADTSDRKKVLVDCRESNVALTETDRFQSGVRVAEVFGSRYMLAVVMPEGQVTKLGEIAAVNRGARLLVTESIDEANSWLLGP